MENIIEWLDREQKIKLQLESDKTHKNRFTHKKQLDLAIAKQDIEFIKMRNKGIKNLHPAMLKRLSNVI